MSSPEILPVRLALVKLILSNWAENCGICANFWNNCVGLGTSISVDVLKRFYKLRGCGSYFLTGTDEHGQKVEKAALDKGVDPKKFTDR